MLSETTDKQVYGARAAWLCRCCRTKPYSCHEHRRSRSSWFASRWPVARLLTGAITGENDKPAPRGAGLKEAFLVPPMGFEPTLPP